MFKEGDKVVCINGKSKCYTIPENTTYTVELYTIIREKEDIAHYGGDIVLLEELGYEFRADRFMLLTDYRKEKLKNIEQCSKKEIE